MSDKTITITTDASDFPVAHHGNHGLDGGSFTAGLVVGAAGFWFAQRRRRARLAEQAGPSPDRAAHDAEVAALARRTAALEKIVTSPGARLDREIDALR